MNEQLVIYYDVVIKQVILIMSAGRYKYRAIYSMISLFG